MDIYGRDGKPISLEEFAAVPRKQRIVKRSRLLIGPDLVTVLTEWDGEDMSRGDQGVPCPFSTLAYSEAYPKMMMPTPTEKHARVAHELVCGFVRSQGGKGGWRVPAYFLSHVWRNPKTVRTGWINLVLAAFVVLLQLSSLTASALTWNWDWSDTLPAIMLLLWSWLLANAARGLKDRLKDRREERRQGMDKAEFEKIVGQIKS